MLESGFTRVGEFHYLHHTPGGGRYDDVAEMSGRIAAAAAATGIGLTLLPVFYAHGGFGGQPAGAAQARFLNDVDGFAALVERAGATLAPDGVIGIAPHSLRAATPGELRALLAMADRGPVHIHIAEQVKEVADCVAWSGKRPVGWLLDNMPVDARWTLVHATHVEPGEVAGIAASGAVAGLCPITEANLGDGVFPAAQFMALGGMIGIGSDSNVRIDAAEEWRLLEYGQRPTRRARNVLATDIVSLNRDDPAFAERKGDALVDSWVFASRAGVDCVWRGGAKQVAGGRHRDRDAIEARYRVALNRLMA
ncbi:amidohydrolase family domain-containing protein [Ditylenchus destructor]|uniref:Amidohydrolase family domain-containing protein n=1 Tax=Ditylenchus destructor TaxID=166010 RepID=A0AAD4QW46_9BILA|nr:amidohydrolase family domain-containing protein [Ditylenchus destructor]